MEIFTFLEGSFSKDFAGGNGTLAPAAVPAYLGKVFHCSVLDPGQRPWGDSNARSQLRRLVLYPLSYRGLSISYFI